MEWTFFRNPWLASLPLFEASPYFDTFDIQKFSKLFASLISFVDVSLLAFGEEGIQALAPRTESADMQGDELALGLRDRRSSEFIWSSSFDLNMRASRKLCSYQEHVLDLEQVLELGFRSGALVSIMSREAVQCPLSTFKSKIVQKS